MGYESPLTIAEVMQDISVNKYVLPSIQREYVWGTTQIERLFDSIMQDYPIGAFLFWELSNGQHNLYEFYSFLRKYHEKKCRHNTKIDLRGSENVMAVLDGQQRLTSIYIGLKGSYAYKMPYKQWKNDEAFPERKLYLNIVEPKTDSSDKFEFKFLTSDEYKNDNQHHWFLVGDILNMKELGDVMSYLLKNIVFSGIYSQEQGEYANNTLSQLFKVIHTLPSISYHKVKSPELDKVLNIFIRVNSGGTVLSYSDLLLSIATAQWDNLDAREEINDCVDNINAIGGGFNVNKDFVLKSALVLTGFSDIAFKVDNFNKDNMLKIENNWKNIKKVLYQAFQLVSSFGFNRDSLKSNNAVIPIAYYLLKIGMPENFNTATSTSANREKIKKWLLMSLLKRAFSGQPDNVLRPIRTIIDENGTKEFPIAEIINKFKGTSKTIVFTSDDIENLLEHQYGKGETLTILMLLYPSLDFNNKFHIDHMYPKSAFTKKNLIKKGVSSDKVQAYMECVNDLSNLQLLAAIPNIEKQNQDFAVWFANTYKTDAEKIQYRTIHYIPDMEYSYANFELFLTERRKKLKSQLEKILL